MVIKIQEPKKEGYKPTLKLSRMLPFEYATVSKQFAEPITGTAQMKDPEGNAVTKNWHLYTLHVEEFKTQNPKTGENITETPNEDYGYFANSEKVHELIKDIPVGVRFKIRTEEVEGNQGTYNKFVVDMLDEVKEEVSSGNVAPDKTLDERIADLKKAGTSKEDAIAILEKEFDVDGALIGGKYESN